MTKNQKDLVSFFIFIFLFSAVLYGEKKQGVSFTKETVASLQKALKKEGYTILDGKGEYGPHTRYALRQYEEKNNLEGLPRNRILGSLGISLPPRPSSRKKSKIQSGVEDVLRQGGETVRPIIEVPVKTLKFTFKGAAHVLKGEPLSLISSGNYPPVFFDTAPFRPIFAIPSRIPPPGRGP